MKNRKGLAAVALCDPSVITCARQRFRIRGDFLPSGRSGWKRRRCSGRLHHQRQQPQHPAPIQQAKSQGLTTAAFLGKEIGGKAKGQCDFEIIIPADTSHRIQEGHKILFHTLCEWVDQKVM